MYFGFRDEFEYFQCDVCGCLQIRNIPDNITKYYPKEYKAYQLNENVHENALFRYLRRKKLEHSLGINSNLMGTLMNAFIDKDFIRYFEDLNINIDSSILDVGTGHGSRLIGLKKKGFKNLTGIEPFIDKDIKYDIGVNVYKRFLHEAEGQYDLVMLNHSFEHMPDSITALKDVYRLLKNNRSAMIRIPVADSYAWEKYGVNWIGMDPPRHYYLHTKKSMEILSAKTGFTITSVKYDSSPMNYAISEQYEKDISMYAPNSVMVNREKSIFTKKQLHNFEKLATRLNKSEKGDTACFYLYKK
jgi:SAM-dependent methyltransferase